VKRPHRLHRLILGTLVLAALGVTAAGLCRFELLAWRFREVIHPAAARYNVPPALIASVIWRETRFRPYRVGRAGELGLMQVMPASAQEWARAEQQLPFRRVDLLDPYTNVLAGTWYLHRALDRWSNLPDPLPRALAEYNAGRSNALRWDRSSKTRQISFTNAISYPTTQRYVADILWHYRTFGRPWQRLWPAGGNTR
jgi:soluble lytic murein transglycosylase